jgi:carbamoyl-phosphate synthase small subunit
MLSILMVISLSNGPGDPEPLLVNSVAKEILANKPLFGICLGHQVMGLANGISTIKCLMGIEDQSSRKKIY